MNYQDQISEIEKKAAISKAAFELTYACTISGISLQDMFFLVEGSVIRNLMTKTPQEIITAYNALIP